jgi:uncharacterized protein YsxB (DUF464 family)
MKSILIAVLFVFVSASAFAGAEQYMTDCGLSVYDSDGNVIDVVLGTGHVVINKKGEHLICHAFSENAAALFTNAELYYSTCNIPGGSADFEMDNLNVSTPSGQVHFMCHIKY